MTKQDVTLPLDVGDWLAPSMLTLDPGGTTGWTYYSRPLKRVTCGQLGPRDHHVELLDMIEGAAGRDLLDLVYEQFEFRQDSEVIRQALSRFIEELRPGRIRSLSTIIATLESIVGNRTSRDKLVLTSREYIGVAKLVAQQHPSITLYSQSASQAKTFVNDAKLDALGWLRPTRGMQHARDALRHFCRQSITEYRPGNPILKVWLEKSRQTQRAKV